MKQQIFTVILLIGLLLVGVKVTTAQETRIADFANEKTEFRDISLGVPMKGANILTATLTNHSNDICYYAVDIRTISSSLGLANFQKFYCYKVSPGKTVSIETPYFIASPLLSRIIVRLGVLDEYFDREFHDKQSDEWKEKHYPPNPQYFWRKIIDFDVSKRSITNQKVVFKKYEVFLNSIQAKKLATIKSEIPGLVDDARKKENELRTRLKQLFLGHRKYPESFGKEPLSWSESYNKKFNSNDLYTDLFSISGDNGEQIIAFLMTRNKNKGKAKPLVILLGGNPGGVKEILAIRAMSFSLMGFHVVGIERRVSARRLDSISKFQSNFTDPVADAIRVMDYLESEISHMYTRIGIYGFSAGAQEAKFVTALDNRISAMVSACGTTSHNSLFKDKECWIPTLSGFIIYPEIGLESPYETDEVMTSERFLRYKDMVNPEHNELAKKAYERVIPNFEYFDAINVMPLVAPVPLLIITGAQDIQFTVAGVMEVDKATRRAYQDFSMDECYDLAIQPRASHYISPSGSNIVFTFLDRWLK